MRDPRTPPAKKRARFDFEKGSLNVWVCASQFSSGLNGLRIAECTNCVFRAVFIADF